MEAEINLNTVRLPVPMQPVPVNTELFPMLFNLLRGQTTDFPAKLLQLEHYYISPLFNAIYEGRALKPETINMDGVLGIGMYQGFAGDFTPPQPMLSVASGSFARLSWEGSELGSAFNVHHFQTASFGTNALDARSEKAMFPYLGFFDWKAVLLEYYKQTFAYLREKRLPHPQFLAVSLNKHAQKRQMWNLQAAGAVKHTTEELMTIDERIKDQEAAWLNGIGFPFRGSCPADCSFLDVRDIEPNENFQKILRVGI